MTTKQPIFISEDSAASKRAAARLLANDARNIDSISISGKVIKGAGYGKKIGFPTLNLDRRDFLKLKKKPAFGVYRGVARLSGKGYKAGIVIGPLDKKGLPKVEAHLIGFFGDVYAKKVVIEIGEFIRKFKKFKNEKALASQIKKDMAFVARQQV